MPSNTTSSKAKAEVQFVPLAYIALLTLVLYVWGQRERQNRDVLLEYDEKSVTGDQACANRLPAQLVRRGQGEKGTILRLP